MELELKAKEIVESGKIRLFEEFLRENSDKIKVNHLFKDRTGFPVILVQTYRKAGVPVQGLSTQIKIDDYKHCLRFLVEMGCDLNVQDEMGRTFAHWTIQLQCLEFLSIALELGCNALLQDSEGETIVHLAIRHNYPMALEIIKLYASNCNVFEAPSETSGATPLIYAVQIGAVDIVKKLLQLSVNVDSQENNQYKRTALHYALFTDNEEIFTLLLKNKAKADVRDYKDKNIMDRVAEHPKDNFLKILASHSNTEIPPKTSDKVQGHSPITLACKNGDYSMLCNLIDKEKDTSQKIDLHIVDSELRTPLHYCADNSDTKCAEKLLELDPKLIEKRDKNGFTPLHLATMANNKKLVQLLLKKGSNTKEKDNDGHTSLHWAVVCCATELIDLLLKTDPEIARIIDNHGASPLHYATQSFLNSEGSVQGPIVIEKLLKNNRELINSVDFDNRTPLLWAATLGITDCCQILLEGGADKNHRDNNGLSALHCAASRGHYDVVDLLVNTWAMMADIVDKNLCTPLFYAVTLKHMPIIHFLVGQRSNPNHQDIKGRSVAHCAALKGYCDILDLIRRVGGSLTLKNNIGDLPLHEAAETGKLEVCQILLEKMAECKQLNQIDSVNNCGLAPLHKAAQNNFEQICKLLVSQGANVNLLTSQNSRSKSGADMSNLTPLDLATDSMTINLLKNLKGKSAKELREDKNPDRNMNTIQINTGEQCDEQLTQANLIQSDETKDICSCDDRISQFQQSIDNNSKDSISMKSLEHSEKRGSMSSEKYRESLKSNNKFTNENSTKKPTSRYSYQSNNKDKSLQNRKYPEKSFISKSPGEKNFKTNNKSNRKNQELEKFKRYSRNSGKSEINIDNIDSQAEVQSVSSKSFSVGSNHETQRGITGKSQDKMRSPNVARTGLGVFDKTYSKKPATIEKTKNAKQSSKLNHENEDDYNHSSKENQGINSNFFAETPDEEFDYNQEKAKQLKAEQTSNKKSPTKIAGKTTSPGQNDEMKSRFDRSLHPIDNTERDVNSGGRELNEKIDHELIGNEMENNSNTNSNQTASSSISSQNSDGRKQNKPKGIDLSSKVVKSVREYESVRGQSRSLSDQRRQEMLQGYNKGYRFDRILGKTTTKSDKSKRIIDQVDKQELNSYDAEAAKKRSLFPKAHSKEEQIRMAYEGQPSISTSTLYSYLP